jgi:hypothetical protein
MVLKSSGEIDCLSFTFINLCVPVLTPQIYCSGAPLQFTENMTFMFLCYVNTGIIHKQSEMSSSCRGGIIYI